ncbi:prephenate dehydratase [Prochlorococcus marinus]|uniref:Prephenate dehydratase n=1 Tax=Prochlorococcus marinus (strain MIT 9211) TaxID=93059 RepID=A9BCJ6_PROM4|nr:prephenate dehydratase [Prochlorococcus marinus]ABX09558.1 Chorismate mutase-Prephenate dehydratase [Prochlorococcus marinus str. MIT 9211]
MPTKVAYLGPRGTYAEKAAYALVKLDKLSEATLLPCSGIRSVIENVATKHCEAAVVPIENSVEGGVTETLDALWGHPNLFIKSAVVIPIRHALIGSGSLEEISEVLSHPQALAQCSGWLNQNLPNCLQLPTSSTSEAVRMVQGSKFRAAIGSTKAALEINGLSKLAYPINDVQGNCTRFVLLQNNESNQEGDIASFAFSLHSNKPGSLLKALNCIASLGLNMSRIESRPSKRELGEYIFFIDIDLKDKLIDTNKKLKRLLEPLCENIVYFGSYKNEEFEID